MKSVVEDRISIRSDLRCLEEGCEHGDLTIAFAMAGCDHVYGIDNVPCCITRAKSYAEMDVEQ